MLDIYDLIEQHNTESMSRQCIVIAKNIPVINDFAISASLSLSKLVKSTALACVSMIYGYLRSGTRTDDRFWILGQLNVIRTAD